MKHEWKKQEKELYLPKNKPEIVTVPMFKYFLLHGKGNPNDERFSEAIGVLYSFFNNGRLLFTKQFKTNKQTSQRDLYF